MCVSVMLAYMTISWLGRRLVAVKLGEGAQTRTQMAYPTQPGESRSKSRLVECSSPLAPRHPLASIGHHQSQAGVGELQETQLTGRCQRSRPAPTGN